MRKTMIVLLTISFIAVVTTSVFAAWPWEKKGTDAAKAQSEKVTAQQQGASGAPQQPAETPKIVLPRVVVPRIIFEQPPAGQASGTTTETLPGGGVVTKNISVGGSQVNEPQKGASPQGVAAPQQPPTMSFGMAAGEFISAKELDPNNIEVKVKTADGKELVVSAPATLTVTKRVKITELNSGEKVMVHYMHNEEDKKDTALYISIGEMPGTQFNIPMPQMMQPRTPPQAPSEKPRGEEKKR